MASAIEAGVASQALSDELAVVAGRLQASVVQVRAGRGGIGSGVVWQTAAATEAGEAPAVTIVTNEHVVRAAGNGTLAVLAPDGRTLPAEVVAHDPEHDLALLRVRASGLQPAPIGDSSALRVGELVLAVGNPFGQINRLTTGIVAARAPADPDLPIEPAQPAAEAADAAATQAEAARPQPPRRGPFDERQRAARTPDLIQADVRLYPGNSGGPLADAQGHVVGINSMVAGELALSIPSRVVQSFIAAATTLQRERPYLGVQVLTVALPDALRARVGIRATEGLLVGEVEPDSPAARASILVGDLLIEVGGRPVAGARDLLVALANSNTGQPLAVTIVRGGERQILYLTPGRQDKAAA